MRTNKVANRLTSTKEDYLRAILKLSQTDGEARVTDLAEDLKLKKSTVCERLKELASQKLITYSPYSKIGLTKKGAQISKNLTYKHRIIEVFLHDMLKISKDKIHDEAHSLEHAFSDEVIEKLSDLLGNPECDPHGSKIEKI